MKKTYDLRRSFYQHLSSIVQELKHNVPVVGEGTSIKLATLTKLVLRHREFIRAVQVSHPLVVVILEGTKILYIDGQEISFQAGDVFVVPSHIPIDVVNQPSSQTGEYVALVVELSADLLTRVRQAYPELATGVGSDIANLPKTALTVGIPLSSRLADALTYLIKSIVHGTAEDPRLHEHHVMEVVLLLIQSDLRDQLLQAVYPDFSTHVRHLIRSNLSAAWSAAQLAQTLGMSVSTLKRRLQDANLSFRQIVDEERMRRGMELLAEGQHSIAQIALACGYESQSRFAARFRKYYSLSPSELKH